MQPPKNYVDQLEESIFSFKSDPEWEERYPANDIHMVSPEFLDDLYDAGEELFKIFNKAAITACKQNFAYGLLGLDKELLNYMLTDYNPLKMCSFISRLDFLLDANNNLKLMEINADTPCAVVESFYGNKIACDYFKVSDPNEPYRDDVKKAFADIISAYSNAGYATDTVCFSAHDAYKEDVDTARYLMYNSGLPNAFYTSLKNLVVKNDGLYAYGRKIDVLYRLHPMEMLINDKDLDGYPTGLALLELVRDKKLVLVNPPEAIMMQIKSLYAYIWERRESNLFTQAEKNSIEKYMLPTYKDAYNFRGATYVKKPIYGREGSDIEVVDANYNIVESTKLDDTDVPSIYQQFCETPTVECVTDAGLKQGKYTFSVFNLLGDPSAVFCRFDENLIASKNSFWLPLGEL